jgi:hypothetical protein
MYIAESPAPDPGADAAERPSARAPSINFVAALTDFAASTAAVVTINIDKATTPVLTGPIRIGIEAIRSVFALKSLRIFTTRVFLAAARVYFTAM